jgi:hypothetical protein
VLSAPKDKVKGWEPLTIQPINTIFDNGWISLGPPCLEASEQFPELNAMRRPHSEKFSTKLEMDIEI